MRSRSHTRAAGAAIMVSLVSATLLIAAGGPARADESYTATGEADGFTVRITNSAIPTVSAVTMAGPTAQATLDSLDQSNAFAAFPYPGDEETGLVGLVGSILGVPTPDLPIIATTSYGQPAQDKQDPGVDLQVNSTHDLSTAKATAGEDGTTKAASSVLNELGGDNSVSTVSTATVQGFTLGNAIQVNGISSTATAKRSSDGTLTRSSHLTIGQISVPGLAIAVPSTVNACPVNQLPVSGVPALPCPSAATAIPVPGGGQTLTQPEIGFEDGTFLLTVPGTTEQVPLDTSEVEAAFAAAGYTVTYQAPRNTTNGIIAAGLTVEQKLPGSPVDVPGNPVLGTPGPTDSVYTFGQAAASVQLQAFDDGSGDDASIPVVGGLVPTVGGDSTPPDSGSTLPGTTSGTTVSPGGTTATTAGTPGTATGLPSAGGAAAGTDAGSLPSTPVAGSTGDTVPAATVAGGETAGTAPAGTALAGRKTTLTNSANLYLALVAAAVLAFGATQIVRIVGVRKLWAS